MTPRLVWERDGLELLDTLARDWVGHDVLVDIVADERWGAGGVLLDAVDVTRRSTGFERPLPDQPEVLRGDLDARPPNLLP